MVNDYDNSQEVRNMRSNGIIELRYCVEDIKYVLERREQMPWYNQFKFDYRLKKEWKVCNEPMTIQKQLNVYNNTLESML